MVKTSKEGEKFSEKEAAARFTAALRGARIAGHVAMENLTQGKAKKQRKPKKKAQKA